MNIVAMIQARIGSTRLPGKVLLPLEGKTVLERVVERAQRSNKIEEVIVITTLNREDMEIVKICSHSGVRVFCGSETDVLDRFYQTAKLLEPDHIVRITADCPLIDAKIIDRVVDKHLAEKNDYTSNVLKETFPDGQDNEIFTFRALKKTWKEARLTSEREHVTLYIRNHPEIFKLGNLEFETDLSKKRWTIDNEEDYHFISEIYKKLHKNNTLFKMQDVLDLLDSFPNLEKINHHIRRNEGYRKSLAEDKMIDNKEQVWEKDRNYIKKRRR
jgi:spore coat polysaccharide biosynthesis protein SpsF